MDPLWIIVAFALGLAARWIGLPPLVGFLAAGFALNAFGVEGGQLLDDLESMGVTLLLFTIGLKLRVQALLRPEVWGAASVHMLVTVAIFGGIILVLAASNVPLFDELDFSRSLILAFALSFSSTVFAVKLLEEMGDSGALYGRVAVGILIMQDIFAVLFLAGSDGKIPSLYSPILFGLLLLRPVFYRVLERAGHGELLILLGICMGLGVGYGIFEMLGVKGDLGALLVGMLLAPHRKAGELAKSLMGFKDLFLVAFFLNIGISGTPTLPIVGIALLLAAVVPLKVFLYFFVLTRFRMRARSSLFAAFSLANYSEFGLIVASVGVKNGWLEAHWLTALALAVSFTFVAASPLNVAALRIYARWRARLLPFESAQRHPEEHEIDPRGAQVAIVGMGRVGCSAYDSIEAIAPGKVIGIDQSPDAVERNLAGGRHVVLGDITDEALWERTPEGGGLRVMLLTTDSHAANLFTARRMSEKRREGLLLGATARYADEAEELRDAGVDLSFDFFAEAGTGFAEHVRHVLEGDEPPASSS